MEMGPIGQSRKMPAAFKRPNFYFYLASNALCVLSVMALFRQFKRTHVFLTEMPSIISGMVLYTVWKNEKFTLTEKIFREINSQNR